MKFHVYRRPNGLWRFTNFHNCAGDCETWFEAYSMARYLSRFAEPDPRAAAAMTSGVAS